MSRFAIVPAVLIVGLCCGSAAEADEASAASASHVQDVLAAEQAGLAQVQFVPNDSRSAQIVVANRSTRPLTLRLPAAFAGTPVVAQMGMGMGMGMGGGNQGLGGGAQAVGGGGGMMGGMGGMGGGFNCWVAREVYGAHDQRWVEFRTWMAVDAPEWLREGYTRHGESVADWLHDRPAARRLVRVGMDAAIEHGNRAGVSGGQWQARPMAADGSFVVRPGKRLVLRFATVCLEHGKPEPSPRLPYKLVALESFSPDPRLPVVMTALAGGQVSQKAAQAAAWHIANGLSWERLAAEMIDHAGGHPDEPFFTPQDLAAGRALAAEAERIATEKSAGSPTTPTE